MMRPNQTKTTRLGALIPVAVIVATAGGCLPLETDPAASVDPSRRGRMATSTSENWDSWELSGDGDLIRMTTSTSENWDSWEVTGDLSELSTATQAAVLFVPVFSGAIRRQAVNRPESDE